MNAIETPHPVFICLSGKKQAGKDTAAQMIVDLLQAEGKKVVVSAFAEPLKTMCIDILGLNRDEVYGTNEQKNSPCHIQWDGLPEDIRLKYAVSFVLASDGVSDPLPRSGPMTNREVLQVIGTDIFRSIYNDVWANAPFNRTWDADVVILTDCRFPNEKYATEKANGVIIRLERDTGFVDNHPSEVALDGFSFENTYQNNGTLGDLADYVVQILKKQGLI